MICSCKSNTIDAPEKPANLISKNTMVDIIYDMAIINAAKGVNRKILELEGFYPEDYVFRRYNIDSLQFALSSEYYAYNLKVYEDIYNRVRVRLNKDKRHYNMLIQAEQEKKDSIRKANRALRDSIKKIGQDQKKKLIKPDSSLKQGRLRKIDTSQAEIDQ
jgi:hypothetical protein